MTFITGFPLPLFLQGRKTYIYTLTGRFMLHPSECSLSCKALKEIRTPEICSPRETKRQMRDGVFLSALNDWLDSKQKQNPVENSRALQQALIIACTFLARASNMTVTRAPIDTTRLDVGLRAWFHAVPAELCSDASEPLLRQAALGLDRTGDQLAIQRSTVREAIGNYYLVQAVAGSWGLMYSL
ncbi:hypothetical protein BDN67DRAFT_983623 [Paxillus ammoniavirescens]|nr:hypothetical protein BDN67DRAFT_983623 [Paxillus ammoniavirescens]